MKNNTKFKNLHNTIQNTFIKSGDIEPNTRPMPNVLQGHPPTHKFTSKTYFILSTIKFHPEYQHITQPFSPSLKTNHPNHNNAFKTFPNLSSYINKNRHYSTSNILFALITTIGPNIDTCEYLFQNLNMDWTSFLLTKLNALRNPPETHIRTIHPYTQISQDNLNIINPPTTIHDKIYKYIHQKPDPPSLEALNSQFPYLPIYSLKETVKIFKPLTEYIHPPPTPPLPQPPPPQHNQSINHHTQS